MRNSIEKNCVDYIRSMGDKPWSVACYEKLWEYICAGAEESYAAFSAKLLPEVATQRVLGIRLPVLRKYAAAIGKGSYSSFLVAAKKQAKEKVPSLEQNLLRAFVIGQIRDWEEAKREIISFIPLIDNWSVNDSFCSSLKIANAYPEQMYELLLTYLSSEQTYEIRFALVMLLNYYRNETYIERVLSACDRNDWKEYYVQMAAAWTISMCYVSFREETLTFLENCHLDDFTYNKAIQKMVESRQVTKEEKDFLRTLKRN